MNTTEVYNFDFARSFQAGNTTQFLPRKLPNSQLYLLRIEKKQREGKKNPNNPKYCPPSCHAAASLKNKNLCYLCWQRY